ncbi:hypothetical protein THAOC_11609 [Thalassiosira oceanica]|uniref:Uncharacterized protein n=1 Tax=Thalassiosira oceanica TaxID=159749 RepID=K0SM40_THAOC|nr:hypothetical protein THAOC_11609 [Thalassiosira oceanica]|eukprot:EJK67368.1 hypothetical protein THAOC_11609 [Thalassiosira oceanica]
MHPYNTIGVLLCGASAQGAQINTRRYRHYPPIRLSSIDAKAIRGPKRRDRELKDASIKEVNLSEFSIPLVLEVAEMSMPSSSTEDEAGPLDSEKITVILGKGNPHASKLAGVAGAAAGAGLLVAFAAGGFLKVRRRKRNAEIDNEEDSSVDGYEEEEDQVQELRLGISKLGYDCESLKDGTLRIDTSV